MKTKIIVGIVSFGVLILIAVFMHHRSSTHREVNQIESSQTSETGQNDEAKQKLYRLKKTLRIMSQMKQEQDGMGEAAFDPILSLVEGDRNVVVLDAEKLKDSPTGKLVVGCIEKFHKKELKNIEDHFGINPLKDAGRIALAHHFLLVTGKLDSFRSGDLYERARNEDYGTNGEIFTPGNSYSPNGPKGGLWGDELLVFSDNMDDIQEAMDITEGQEQDHLFDPFADRKGSLYGNMDPRELLKFFGSRGPQGQIATLLESVSMDMRFDIQTTYDVRAVIEFEFEDSATMQFFEIGLEGLQTALSIKSSFDDLDPLMQLLDYAEIKERGNSLRLEFLLPYEFVVESLSYCN